MKLLEFIAYWVKKLPAFYLASEKLDTIIWNDKRGKCLELQIFGKFIGYF